MRRSPFVWLPLSCVAPVGCVSTATVGGSSNGQDGGDAAIEDDATAPPDAMVPPDAVAPPDGVAAPDMMAPPDGAAECGVPVPESCNGLDDDCNGRVDDIAPGACSPGPCARLADGTARCWGYNAYGQLGDGTTTTRLTPAAVMGIAGVTRVAAYYRTTCALLADTTVRCWGDNGNGQVGDGTSSDRPRPTAVTDLPGPSVCGATAGAPLPEVCNGLDDDCDGAVDDGVCP